MPTVALFPTAVGSQGVSGCAAAGGAGNITNLRSDDDNTSYYYNTPAGVSGYAYFYPDALPAAAMVNSFNYHYYKAADTFTGGGWGGVGGSKAYKGGSSDDEAWHFLNYPSPGTYTPYSYAHARPGGGSWIPADFTGTTGSVEFTWYAASGGGDPDEWRWSYSFVSVTYTPPSGGFVFLIGSWLGTLVSVGLHEMPGLLSHIVALGKASRPRSIAQSFAEAKHRKPIIGAFETHEIEAAWRDLRDYRHPVYFGA